MNRMEKNGLLEIISVHRTGDELDESVKKDKDYQETLTHQQKAFDKLLELNLTAEQKRVVDHVISANNHNGAVYEAVAYRCGMEMEEIMRLPQ